MLGNGKETANKKVFGLLSLVCICTRLLKDMVCKQNTTLTVLFVLACGIQFVSVIVRLFNTALFDTSRAATQAHSKTLPLSNERNLTLLTANCLHSRTARRNLDSILNTMQQQIPFSDSKDSPGIKRLLHSVFSKDFGINTKNLPTSHLFRFLLKIFYTMLVVA